MRGVWFASRSGSKRARRLVGLWLASALALAGWGWATPTGTAASTFSGSSGVSGQRGVASSVLGWVTTALTAAQGYQVSVPITVKTGTGYVARTVKVQQRLASATKWTTVTTAKTTATGAYTVVYTVPKPGSWVVRVSVPATATANAVNTPTRTVTSVTGAATTITGWPTGAATVPVGTPINTPVTVTSAGVPAAGRSAVVQRAAVGATAWTTIATGVTDTTGKWTATFTPTAGTYSYRVQAPPTLTAASGATGRRTLTAGFASPVVTYVTPHWGPATGGTSITIVGSHLVDATAVTFGGVPAASMTIVSDTAIEAVTPAHSAGFAEVTVVGPGGSSAPAGDGASEFRFMPPPTVTAFGPVSGTSLGGTPVGIQGLGLDGDPQVLFGGVPQLANLSIGDGITVTAPPHAPGVVDVTIETVGGSVSLVGRFTYTAPHGFIKIASEDGSYGGHSCGITAAGGVKCWGVNSFGSLGIGSTVPYVNVPTQVSGITSGATAIAVGAQHACAVVVGRVKCWGRNYSGQLGNGTTSNSTIPVQVRGIAAGATAVSVNDGRSCAIVSGSAFCWGEGPIGDGTTTPSLLPKPVSGLAGSVSAISVGGGHICVIATGGAKCWGWNAYGQLGDGSTADKLLPSAVQGLATGVREIATGANHTCAISGSTQIYCWGQNDFYQLGDGTTTSSAIPVPQTDIGYAVTSLDAANDRTCAVSMVWGVCWGQEFPVPTAMVGGTNGVTQITGGDSFTCLIDEGYTYCTGDNTFGELGDGSADASASDARPVFGFGEGAPTLANVEPRIGPASGGNMVELIGSRISGPVDVLLDGRVIYSATIDDGGNARFNMPPGAKGSHQITVQNRFGTSPTLATTTYTYQ